MRSDQWLAQQLPVAMTDDDFLMSFLSIFQSMADTVLAQIDGLPHVFDPAVAPEQMVQAMTEWIGVDWGDSALPEHVQREMLRLYSSEILRHRGTVHGLRSLLEFLCDDPDSAASGVEVDDGGEVYLLTYPDESRRNEPSVHVRLDRTGRFRTEDLIRIIRAEVPLGVTLTIDIAGARVWPGRTKEETTLLRTGGHLPTPVPVSRSATRSATGPSSGRATGDPS